MRAKIYQKIFNLFDPLDPFDLVDWERICYWPFTGRYLWASGFSVLGGSLTDVVGNTGQEYSRLMIWKDDWAVEMACLTHLYTNWYQRTTHFDPNPLPTHLTRSFCYLYGAIPGSKNKYKYQHKPLRGFLPGSNHQWLRSKPLLLLGRSLESFGLRCHQTRVIFAVEYNSNTYGCVSLYLMQGELKIEIFEMKSIQWMKKV